MFIMQCFNQQEPAEQTANTTYICLHKTACCATYWQHPVDQLRTNNNIPPADLWRHAVNRGHSGATLRLLPAKQ